MAKPSLRCCKHLSVPLHFKYFQYSALKQKWNCQYTGSWQSDPRREQRKQHETSTIKLLLKEISQRGRKHLLLLFQTQDFYTPWEEVSLLPFWFSKKSKNCTAFWLQTSDLQCLHETVMQGHSIPHIHLPPKGKQTKHLGTDCTIPQSFSKSGRPFSHCTPATDILKPFYNFSVSYNDWVSMKKDFT